MKDSLEDRVERLEAIAFDGDALQRSVTRLGSSAGALGDALLQIDRNQQALTKLGTQLATVERTAATKDEVMHTKEEQEQQAREFSKATLRRTYAIGLVLTTFGIIGAAITSEVLDHRRDNQIRVCEQRNTQTELIISTLDENGLPGAADRFQSLVIDCQKEFNS